MGAIINSFYTQLCLSLFVPTHLSKMSHHHDGSCGHEDDHDHDHSTSDLGPQDNLFTHIDLQNVVAFNTSSQGSEVIKPWHERLDETKAGLHCIRYIILDLCAVPRIRRRRPDVCLYQTPNVTIMNSHSVALYGSPSRGL